MATISSPGIGSLLDVNTIVEQLVAIERKPIERLQTEAATIQSKLSSFGLLQSYLGNLRDAADRIGTTSFWSQTGAVSTDPAAVGASAGAAAVPASYSIEVSQLAQAQSLSSRAYADKLAAVGTGTLTIQLGQWSGDLSSFSASSTPAVDIAIGAADNSLDKIRDKINAAGAGVAASIVNDASGARLVIRSSVTGEVNAVRITATDDDGNASDNSGLSALSYDPPGGTGRMTRDIAAKNLAAKVNGLSIGAASNTLTTVIDGLTLNLGKVTSAPVDVKVSLATDQMKKSIGDLVKAYNDINKYIADQTKYDGATKVAGILQGDRATLTVQSQLRGAAGAVSAASSVFSRLSVLGIEAQRDGSLKVDDAKLADALATRPDEVAKAFSADDGVVRGFAVALGDLAAQMIATDGTVTRRSEGFRDSIRRNEKEQDRLEDRVAATRDRLLRQYTALDTRISKLNNLSNYITQQMALFTNSLKSSSGK